MSKRRSSVKSAPKADALPKLELAIAATITAIVVILHLVFLVKAGALWRDEINTVELATLPTIHDIWSHLEFDSFPMLWFMILRVWLSITHSDFALRLLGCAIGLAVVALLWVNARRLKIAPPLLSLGLFAAAATTIRVGDSLRAYGFGVLLFLITLYFIWKIVEQPTRLNVVAALLAAVLSVQTLYYNAVLLFAICMGAIAVSARHREWRKVTLLLGIGGVAAATVVPYLAAIKGASDWNIIIRILDYTVSFFGRKCREAIGKAAIWFWVVTILVAIIGGIRAQLKSRKDAVTPRDKDFALFAMVALIVGGIAYFLFLKVLRYQTQPWYYFALMALVAVAVDILFSVAATERTWRVVRLVLAVAVAAVSLPTAWTQANTRLTNADLVAAEVEKKADPADFLVVNPWYFGVAFNRYYHGQTPWITLPPVEFLKYHRYDLVKQKMTMTNQIDVVSPVFQQIAKTLQAGNRVWLVGGVDFAQPGEKAFILPPAPQSNWGWAEGPYDMSWSLLTGNFLEKYARELHDNSVATNIFVNPHEQIPLVVVSGWRTK